MGVLRAFTAPLRGAQLWWAGIPRISLRFIRGYFHLLPPGATCGGASCLRRGGLGFIISPISESRCGPPAHPGRGS